MNNSSTHLEHLKPIFFVSFDSFLCESVVERLLFIGGHLSCQDSAGPLPAHSTAANFAAVADFQASKLSKFKAELGCVGVFVWGQLTDYLNFFACCYQFYFETIRRKTSFKL